MHALAVVVVESKLNSWAIVGGETLCPVAVNNVNILVHLMCARLSWDLSYEELNPSFLLEF